MRKTITLTDKHDGWTKAQIDAGQYTNDSEYIRDLTRREQQRYAEMGSIRATLIEGDTVGNQGSSVPVRSSSEAGPTWLNIALPPPPNATLNRSGLIPASFGA